MNDSEEKKPLEQKPAPSPSADSDFEEAVDRVYKKYGSNIDAFVKDIQKDIQKRAANDSATAARYRLVV